ncbi:hypothetical protein T484DRAFT_1866365, partial [Baffinella frigidus]
AGDRRVVVFLKLFDGDEGSASYIGYALSSPDAPALSLGGTVKDLAGLDAGTDLRAWEEVAPLPTP